MRAGGALGSDWIRFSRSAPVKTTLLLTGCTCGACSGSCCGTGVGEFNEESWVRQDSWLVEDVVRGRVIGANVDTGFIVGVESVGRGVNVVWDIVNDSRFHFGSAVFK